MRRTRYSIVLIAALIFPGLLAQSSRAQRGAQEEALRLKTELVEIDVIVTDKNHHQATNLKKDDFVLLEDDKPQQISFFSLFSNPARGPEGPVTSPATQPGGLNIEPGRFVFLILDQYHISRANYPRLRESLLRFVRDDLGPRDQLAVIGTSGNLAVFQQATSNARALELAINAFLGVGSDYTSLAAIDEGLAQAQKDIGMPPSGAPGFYEEYALRGALRSLQAIAQNVAEAPGRKIAIFVSENLPISLSTSTGEDLSYELQQVIGKSRRSGLVFYTLDPRGLTAAIPGGSAADYEGKSALRAASGFEDPGATADRLFDSRLGMRELAAATGGFSILNRNDLALGLEDVLADNEAYYLLAYYPTNSERDGKFRRLKLIVRDRPELTVRTRRGYFALTAKEAKQTSSKQDQVKQALGSLLPLRNVKVAILRSVAVTDPQTGARVARLIIQIDAHSFPFKQEGQNHVASIEVTGFAYDLKNKLVDGFSKSLNLKLKPDTYSAVLREGMNLRGEIKLKKSGLYNIRVVAINADSGEIGTASDWLESP
jgi:VWFA-related protein